MTKAFVRAVNSGSEGWKRLKRDLLREGFENAGYEVSFPDCASCRACAPLRIVVDEYEFSKSERRMLNRPGITVECVPYYHDDAHYDLFQRFQLGRHPGSPMRFWTVWDFQAQRKHDTHMLLLRDNTALYAVAYFRREEDSIRASYTIYDPANMKGSPGRLAMLHLIDYARCNGIPYIDLSVWAKGSPKVSDKVHFTPLEIRTNEGWRRFNPDSDEGNLDYAALLRQCIAASPRQP